MKNYLTLVLLCCGYLSVQCQSVLFQDDFEGNGNITTWAGDDCLMDNNFANPFAEAANPSATVLQYHDTGGAFANVRFDVANNFDLSGEHTFSLKLYVPSSGLTGNQRNQVSLKLQDGNLGAPWSTQSEIIKTVETDQWQTITFDFATDEVINLDPNSPPATSRTDFNRVLIQLNGEDNTDQVLAYLDDVSFTGSVAEEPSFDCLVWADEFNDTGAIDATKWFHQTQLPQGDSWYNGEIQHYTDRLGNSFQEDGALQLVAKRERLTDQGVTKDFTSARLNSKFAFTYGRVDVRAKLPTGVGTWPAIWMLGQNIDEDGAYWDNEGFDTTPWPACGEIDIMEHWGDNQNYVSSAMHTPSSFGGTVNVGGTTIPTASTEFHVYTMVWTEEKIAFSVDGVVHYTYNPAVKNADTWPFDAPQYLLLNIAILPNIAAAFTSSALEVDYVRVYQSCATSTADNETETDLRFYPNPVSNELTVELPAASTGSARVRLINAQGQVVRTYVEAAQGPSVNLSDLGGLARGVYVLSLELDGKYHALKFVKE